MIRAIVLMNWTDQGIKNAKESPNRYAQAREQLGKLGVEIEQVYWTLGMYDLVAIVRANDVESLTAGLLGLGMQGNLRTTTIRAFDEAEFKNILGKLG